MLAKQCSTIVPVTSAQTRGLISRSPSTTERTFRLTSDGNLKRHSLTTARTALPLEEVERQEQLLQDLLTQAHAVAQADPGQGEEAFRKTLRFAKSVFGDKSVQVASVLVHVSSFYCDQNKPVSARQHWEKMRRIMRW